MTTPTDSQQSGNASHTAENSTGILRLFNLDLPALKKTSRIFPEQADLSAIHRVLDIACGAGEWVIKIAQVYPHMQVVGIDPSSQGIDSASAQAHASGLDNTSFKVMDPLQPLDFPDNSFDLVNARFIASLIPTAAWPILLQECLRTLRHSGIIRLTETDMPLTSSPAFEKLSGMISRALSLAKYSFSPIGRNLSITPVLRRLLHKASCLDIQKTAYVANFSAGMEAHNELAQDFAHTYRLVQPFLIKMGVTTQEEVEQVYQQMLAEMRSDSFCAVGFYLTAWGKKP